MSFINFSDYPSRGAPASGAAPFRLRRAAPAHHRNPGPGCHDCPSLRRRPRKVPLPLLLLLRGQARGCRDHCCPMLYNGHRAYTGEDLRATGGGYIGDRQDWWFEPSYTPSASSTVFSPTSTEKSSEFVLHLHPRLICHSQCLILDGFAEVVSLVNSLSSACSSLRDSSRDSAAASTNDSTAVIVDSSLGGDSSRADSRHSFSDSGQSTVDRSTVDNSRHSTADTVNSGLSSRNIDSLNSRSSVLSSRSSGECSSRGSVGSSSRSSSSRAGGSRDDIEASPGSGEADELAGRPAVGMFEDDLPVTGSSPSMLVVRPILHPSVPRPAPVVLSTFQAPTFQSTHNEAFQFGASAQEVSRRSSEASGGVTEGMGRHTHRGSYGDPVGYDELFKTEDSGDELFSGHYRSEEPDPHGLGADSTTLEDVLDSLLALPSASRSPSPVCGHHPLGRPFSHPGYTKSHQERDNTLPSSPQSLDCPPKHQDDHYGHLRNHNLPTHCKTEGYHKSFSYSSSSGDSSFQQQQQAGHRPLLHEQHAPPPPEGSPVSFFLARDEASQAKQVSTSGIVAVGVSLSCGSVTLNAEFAGRDTQPGSSWRSWRRQLTHKHRCTHSLRETPPTHLLTDRPSTPPTPDTNAAAVQVLFPLVTGEHAGHCLASMRESACPRLSPASFQSQ
ncbi:hypothetical protein GWK47_023177 [Chionoecetes opilio]|uniref:Uncharacterized protein n=1 Tax=Chionoecetes opilio TaxID=41210 RepID=A0A8J4XM42_CHIOP|nr:hypothetical protein GWK47_023177 [Chionoecetes opilio]